MDRCALGTWPDPQNGLWTCGHSSDTSSEAECRIRMAASSLGDEASTGSRCARILVVAQIHGPRCSPRSEDLVLEEGDGSCCLSGP